jgi:hypothetical protein
MIDANGSFYAQTEHNYESLSNIYNPTAHLLAGAMAGIMEHFVMYPIDSVKVSKIHVL